ncbi:ASPIC/UnbV [Candidatus Koribacter versatilis Ellin345]|uniref:ASPIC/UnbV n=1 Tax=Koribacter versatilis (strain Ellin345) TaxID=204669 RepID=Q1IR15_KORVE|nr:CRTAC1 family protein [Candidatus Koribacter versatilis]ABF40685.1 ASPIC/UnbV [Candidatus Koribacter versatilis Ellin345]
MNKRIGKILAASILVCAAFVATAQAQITFKDITQQAGIHFTHTNGATGKKYLPETMGPGCAFLDYDNDGYPDVLLINGKTWAPGSSSTMKLYHNNHNGTFTDVTAKAGLSVPMFGLGVAVGDYDNDGYDDLFVTALGQSHLFHNNGNGTFTDVTKQAGMLGPNEFSTSAAWVDYDKDGKLDLVVANYVQWTPETDIYCTLDGSKKSYCTPEAYKGASVRLWHNLGGGKFEDATAKSGLFDSTSKSLGIAVADVNGDGWPDLIVANDTQPNKLYVNQKNGKFQESAVSAGIAFSEDGVARAGMGVDAADYDRSGKPSIIIGNFSNQMMALYHNEGNTLFVDEAPRSEVGRKSLLTLGFACFFFDYDLDGWPDIFVANGHIEPEIEKIQKRVKYSQPSHLFHNQGNGQFTEVTGQVGTALGTPKVARSAAYADIDNDGDLDLLITTNGGPAMLLRNDGATNKSLRIKLDGTRSNRDGIGAVVTVRAGNDKQAQMLRSGSGYLSASELVLTFGLGQHATADEVQITWPSGQVDHLAGVAAGQTVVVKEGGLVEQKRPYGASAAAPKAARAKIKGGK